MFQKQLMTLRRTSLTESMYNTTSFLNIFYFWDLAYVFNLWAECITDERWRPHNGGLEGGGCFLPHTKGSKHLVWRRVFHSWHYCHLGMDNIWLWGSLLSTRIFGSIPGLYPIGPLFPSCDNQCLPRLRTIGLKLFLVVKVGRIF